MMRPNRKHNSILNSPFVRALINPVKSALPPTLPTPSPSTPSSSNEPIASTSTARTSFLVNAAATNPYLDVIDREERIARGEEDEGEFLIPTQPVSTSDLKGKKRARDDDEEAVEYDAETGKRYGVVTRYSEENLPVELEKYWAQRYRLFSLFDEGCEMDQEGWYSVTPENIAVQIAERCRSSVIVDAFCGVGGNAIQFAFTCERVIAFDTSPVRLACARRNAEIYGVADRITFILADWVEWTRNPPWGGISYQTLGTTSADNMTASMTPASKRQRLMNEVVPSTPTPIVPKSPNDAVPPAYPLSALAPLHGTALFALAQQVTPHVAYYLPRNVDLLEVAELSPLKAGEREGGKRERVEIEEEWMSGKLKAVTAYFGDLVVGAGVTGEVEDAE